MALRMLGGVHALVLSGRAPDLAAYYLSVGGSADPGPEGGRAWPALREVLAGHRDEIRDWLASPPQTNEVGRGAVLAGALCWLRAAANLPVRLVEIGASAGLNLRADRFRIDGDLASYGDADSPVRLRDAWRGSPVPVPAAGRTDLAPVPVLERTGGDQAPIDPASRHGRIRLAAYVWPDQVERLARLRGALDLAAQVPADVRQEPASATIGRTTLEPGTWTVVWHSVVRQYLDPAEAAALADGTAALGAAATPAARFCHVWLEPASQPPHWPAELITWPGGVRRVLGSAAAHGPPAIWTP